VTFCGTTFGDAGSGSPAPVGPTFMSLAEEPWGTNWRAPRSTPFLALSTTIGWALA
jgi:hypothetical protein